jgi:hypothetical protein
MLPTLQNVYKINVVKNNVLLFLLMFSNNLNRESRIKLKTKLIRFFLEQALGHQPPETAMTLCPVTPSVKIQQTEISHGKTTV